MRQIINNTPANSGLGDTLFESMNKINAMTLELYAADSSFADEIDSINLILATINDGTSVLNHRHTIAQIQGLQSALNLKVSTSIYISDMLAINASIQAINDTLSDIIVILNTKIEEAPFSGITYGRNNGTWVVISGSSSALTGLTSTDGSVLITTPSTGVRDLSVAVAASTLSVLVQVRNETGAPLVKGTIVYINGASGNKSLVVKAQANSEYTSNATLGLIQNDIPNNQNGYVVQSGLITGLNTTVYSAGTRIWLSSTVAGAYTNVQPSSPNHSVYIGVISRSHVNQGTIDIAINNTQEFRESSDVFLSALTNNDVIVYDSATDLFKNKSIINALGYTPMNATAAFLPLSGGTLTGTSGAGFIGYNSQSSAPSTPSTGFRLFADSVNRLSWIGTNGFVRTFDGTSNTANRMYNLPNRDITFDNITTATTTNLASGFVKSNGSTITLDSNTYLNSFNPTYTGLLSGTGVTVVTGGSQTGIVDLSQTWDTNGLPTAIKLNVTDRVSNGNSLLMDLQTNSTTKFKVDKDGDTTIIGDLISGAIFLVSTTNTTIKTLASNSTANENIFSSPSSIGTGAIAGIKNIFNASGGFSPSGGTAEYRGINLSPNINQTGGATGISRGLYINPTLTSAADYRAIESTGGANYLSSSITGSTVPSLLNLTQTFNSLGTLANMTTMTLLETGSGGGVSAGFMRFVSGNTAVLTIHKAGTIHFGPAFGAASLGAVDSTNGASVQGSLGMGFNHLLTTQIGYGFWFRNLTQTRTPTSGENGIIKFSETFNPSAGTATHNAININNTINQTATASGITRGLYVNPTVTAAADYRGIEVTAGSIVLPYATASAAYTVKTTDYLVNFTTGTFVASLPTTVGITGKHYILKNSGAGTVTVAIFTTSQTIDGNLIYTLTPNKYVHIVSTGTSWIIIGNN